MRYAVATTVLVFLILLIALLQTIVPMLTQGILQVLP